jgi:hypothetical protein
MMTVMVGLFPASHDLCPLSSLQNVDARHKAGHDNG